VHDRSASNVVAFGAANPTAEIVTSLSALVPAFALMMLNPLQGSLGEEPGWRGFGLPRLLSDRSPLVATLILGVLVAGWHAPLFLTGMYTSLSRSDQNLAVAAEFAANWPGVFDQVAARLGG
jgi:membrane protease YdiL (CAAX protease family)